MTEQQRSAILNRDAAYDGVFYYGVTTTKKVMRPSCRCKQARLENIEIFDTLEEAYAKGYQPCKRCRPANQEWSGEKRRLIASAKEIIGKTYTEKFSLQALADALFVNPSYLARAFKEITGETLLSYHNRLRCEKSKEYLQDPDHNLAYISSMIGYSSSSHYIRNFKQLYGCTPVEYRKTIPPC